MALSEVIARLGFKVDDAALKRAQSGLDGMINKVQQYAGVIAGSMLVRGAARFVSELVTEADELAKGARQLDMSGAALQRWRIAASYSGVEGSKLTLAIKTLSKQAYDASQRSKTATDAFKAIGVEWENDAGQLKDLDTLVREAGFGLANMGNATERVALASTLFGRAGYQLTPMFAEGEEGLAKLLGKLDELGGGLTDELLPLAEEAEDRFFDWKIATDSLKSRLAVAFLPTLARAAGAIAGWIGKVAKASDGTNAFKSVLIALALVSMAPLIRMLVTLGRAALIPLIKFAALYLLVDDLVTFFEGGDSLIGRGLDKIFGRGTASNARRELKGLLKDIQSGDWDGALSKLDSVMMHTFGAVGEQLVKFAVEDLPAFFVTVNSEGYAAWVAWGKVQWQAIQDAGKVIAEKATALGKSIIEGLVSGVTSQGEALKKAIITIVDKSGFGPLAEWLGSHSPSERAYKLFATVPQGGIEALKDYKAPMQQAFNQMVPSMTKRSLAVSQINHNQITVKGGPSTLATARAVGKSVGSQSRSALDDAASLLIPMG